MLSTNTNGK